MRDKSEFRAIRMRCGISHAFLAKKVGCSVALVRKWDDATSGAYPPQVAWDIIDEALETQRSFIWYFVDLIEKIEEEGTQDVNEFAFATWSSAQSFLNAARPQDLESFTGDWQQVNARNIACMIALDVLGYDFRYLDGDKPSR